MDVAVFDDPKLSKLEPDEEVSEQTKLFGCTKSDPNSDPDKGTQNNDKTVLICSAKSFHGERNLLNHERSLTEDKPPCDSSLSQEVWHEQQESTDYKPHSTTLLSDTQLISDQTDSSPFKVTATYTCGINPTSSVTDAYGLTDTDIDNKPEEVTDDTVKKPGKKCRIQDSKLTNSAEQTQKPEKSFRYTNCAKAFRTSAALLAHEQKHTGEKPFACNLCNYRCNQKCSLNRHKRTHAVNKTCKYCGKSFANPGSLTLHERSHTGEKPSPSYTNRTQKEKSFSCSQCDLSFAKRQTLTIHERTHTGEKPFSCAQCGLRFSQRANLCRHERTHTGEKRFKCSFCEKAFTERQSLTYHERIHNGEKPVACVLCGKQHRTKASLRQHELRAHKAKKSTASSYCIISFPKSSHLKVHEPSHTGEKAFFWSVRGAKFNTKVTLREHENSYHEHKLFGCSFCSSKFAEEAKLELHERRFHAGKLCQTKTQSVLHGTSGQVCLNSSLPIEHKPFVSGISAETLLNSGGDLNASAGLTCETVEVLHADPSHVTKPDCKPFRA